MKTPAEIKKGLACCAKPLKDYPCKECPYDCAFNTSNSAVADALILIGQLEEKIAKRDKLLAVMGVRIREKENHDKN